MPPINEPPRACDFIVSEANGYRSREVFQISMDPLAIVLSPGTLLMPDTVVPGNLVPATAAGAAAGNVNAILMYFADTRASVAEGTVIIRDAEVNEGYLLYADSLAANTPWTAAEIAGAVASLNDNGIIVRIGVPATSQGVEPIWP